MSLSKEDLQQQCVNYEGQLKHLEQLFHQTTGILNFLKAQLDAIDKAQEEPKLEDGSKTYEAKEPEGE